jgi:hypothetical protein
MFKTNLALCLEGFHTPEYINEAPAPVQTGFAPTPARSFDLSEIPAKTLSDMCGAFRKEIFKKAKLTDPKYAPLAVPPAPGPVTTAVRAQKLIELVEQQQHDRGIGIILQEAVKRGHIEEFTIVGGAYTARISGDHSMKAIDVVFYK